MDAPSSAAPVVPCCHDRKLWIDLIQVKYVFTVCPTWRDGPAATLRSILFCESNFDAPSSAAPVVPCRAIIMN
jgi:hypothetical protein